MTHQSDIVARLRHGEGQDWDMPYATREEAAALIETQASEIERLRAEVAGAREALLKLANDYRGHPHLMRADATEAFTAIASGAYRETGSD